MRMQEIWGGEWERSKCGAIQLSFIALILLLFEGLLEEAIQKWENHTNEEPGTHVDKRTGDDLELFTAIRLTVPRQLST